MKPPPLLLVVSDIHCGSDAGLAPPLVKLRQGNTVGHGDNHHQAWLWACWTDAVARAKAIIGKSEAWLLVNGDATEGSHHHNQNELLMSDIGRHVEMAAECLRPLAALCRRRFVVKGTECHTLEMEQILARELRAEQRIAKDKWHLQIHGCLIDATHHMGVTSRAYLEATAMSITMGNARLEYLRRGHPIPKVFLRGHRHCGGYFSDGAALFGVTGGWQMLTRHGHKAVPDSIPSPTMLLLDWRDADPGQLPRVHEIKYNPPAAEAFAG